MITQSRGVIVYYVSINISNIILISRHREMLWTGSDKYTNNYCVFMISVNAYAFYYVRRGHA